MENGPLSGQPRTLQVEVAKPETGEYGFLVSFISVLKDHIISEIDDGSAAQAAGLQVTDVILEVNGKGVHGKTAEQLKALVQERLDGVSFTILRDGINRLPRLCRLFKLPGFKGFGFDLHGQPDQTGHYVSHVESGSPAEKAGLNAADVIIRVNGKSVENKTHNEVVKLIKKSPNAMDLMVVPSGKFFEPPRPPQENGAGKNYPPGTRTCMLIRDPPDVELGFDLYAKKGEVGHYITQVTPDSLAETAGLRTGDKILEVNKLEVLHESHRELIQHIKFGGKYLEFLVVNEERDFSDVYRDNLRDPTPDVPEDARRASRVTSIPFSGNGTHWAENGTEASPVIYSVVHKEPKPVSAERRKCHVLAVPGDALGFELIGNKKKSGHYISSVDPNTAAERAGLLPWDRVLEINGTNVVNEPYKKVVELIKNGNGNVLMVVQKGTNPNLKTTTTSAVVEPGSSSTSGASSPASHPRRRSCRMVKDPGALDLGLDVTSSPHKGDHRVTDITPGSVAEAAGLQVGDHILEINGQDMEQRNHQELIELVKRSGPDVEFLVHRDGAIINTSEAMLRKPEVKGMRRSSVVVMAPSKKDIGFSHCRLVKTSQSLGLDLHTLLRDTDPVGHYVVDVDADSPAERAGLRRGHRLLEVNGENVEAASHDEVVDRIQKGPREVDLTVVMTDVDLSNLPSNQPPEVSHKPPPSTIPIKSAEDGQRAWAASGLADKHLGLDLVQATLHHLDWLKQVAGTACLHESRGPVLSRACRRYLQLWLPLAARHSSRPWPAPLDIEWVWHCHLLSPRAYRRDCQFLVGKVVDHVVLSGPERERALEASKALWKEEYPSEPFEMDPYDSRVSPPPAESAALTSELLEAALRQAHFYYQVSLPHFRSVRFLEEAVVRYRKFLFLRRQSSGRATLGLTPCQDMDLVWRTHQLHPLVYHDVMSDLLGSQHALDFQTEATTIKADQKAAFERTRELWRSTFGEDPGRFGALFRGLPVENKLRPLRSEDLARGCAKTMPVTLDRVSIESVPPEVPSFTLEVFTARGEDVVQKVLSLEVKRQGQVWTRDQLPVFHVDAMRSNALKVRALAAPGLIAAEKSFDFTRYLEMDIREDAPVVLTYPFGSEGDFCVAINATLGSPVPGPGIFSLRAGRFETSVMAADSQELWGPAPLPEIAPGVSNVCTFATHALVNHSGQTTLTARVVHSVALLQSVVQIRASGNLAVMAHLIGLEQLPLPSQVNDPKVASFDPKLGERAIIIRNHAGDWGICIGCWIPARKDSGGEPAAGNLAVRFFHLPTSKWHNITLDYESGNYRMALGKVEADLRSGQVTVSPGGGEALAEYVALTFCVAMLHVLCQPRPPNWEPGANYYSSPQSRAPPSRDMVFPLAAGCDVATPSNQFLSIKFGRGASNSGSMFDLHGPHHG